GPPPTASRAARASFVPDNLERSREAIDVEVEEREVVGGARFGADRRYERDDARARGIRHPTHDCRRSARLGHDGPNAGGAHALDEPPEVRRRGRATGSLLDRAGDVAPEPTREGRPGCAHHD